jgi:lipoprotein-releasing system permease protein
MNIAFKIASRYVFPKNNLNFISIITIISIIGITIGVAALIVVMSIFNGFREISEEVILKIDPAIRIINKNSAFINSDDYIKIVQQINQNDEINNSIKSILPILETKAVLINKDKIEVIQLISTGD